MNMELIQPPNLVPFQDFNAVCQVINVIIPKFYVNLKKRLPCNMLQSSSAFISQKMNKN